MKCRIKTYVQVDTVSKCCFQLSTLEIIVQSYLVTSCLIYLVHFPYLKANFIFLHLIVCLSVFVLILQVMLKKSLKMTKIGWWADEENVTFATCSSSLLKAALFAASCTWISNQTISSLVALWVISVILNGSSYLAASVTRLTFLLNLFTQHTEVTSVLHTWSWTWDRDLLLVVQIQYIMMTPRYS